MTMYYDRQGKPLSNVMDWESIYEPGNNHIAETYMWLGLIRVSTVWLGLDHDFTYRYKNINDSNPHPLIFESMVFIEGGWTNINMLRYSTEQDALEGHKLLVKYYCNPLNVIRDVREYKSVLRFIKSVATLIVLPVLFAYVTVSIVLFLFNITPLPVSILIGSCIGMVMGRIIILNRKKRRK